MKNNSPEKSKKKAGCGCLGGMGNAAGCLVFIALILGIAVYVAIKQPERIQYFLDWIGTLQ